MVSTLVVMLVTSGSYSDPRPHNMYAMSSSSLSFFPTEANPSRFTVRKHDGIPGCQVEELEASIGGNEHEAMTVRDIMHSSKRFAQVLVMQVCCHGINTSSFYFH